MLKKAVFLVLLLSVFFVPIESIYGDEVAPDFTLNDISGKTFTLTEIPSKVTLLDFFATWCNPCKVAFPTFRSLYDEYSREQLQIISISPENEEVLRSFSDESQNNMTWIVISDPDSVAFGRYLGSDTRIPHLFLVDSDGYIRYDHIGWNGESDAAELRLKINALLTGTNGTADNSDGSETPLVVIVAVVVMVIVLIVGVTVLVGYVRGWSKPSKKRHKRK